MHSSVQIENNINYNYTEILRNFIKSYCLYYICKKNLKINLTS